MNEIQCDQKQARSKTASAYVRSVQVQQLQMVVRPVELHVVCDKHVQLRAVPEALQGVTVQAVDSLE